MFGLQHLDYLVGFLGKYAPKTTTILLLAMFSQLLPSCSIHDAFGRVSRSLDPAASSSVPFDYSEAPLVANLCPHAGVKDPLVPHGQS
jgi:hypothetical protein